MGLLLAFEPLQLHLEEIMKIPPFELTRKKVAIVGFAGSTRHLAPFDDEEWEIWGLNEAHRQPWMKRITRWFQVHQKWDFTKKLNKSYKEHWDWLRVPHDFPIYMQEEYPDVISSVKYPLDEIIEKFLSNVLRGEVVNKYFTSSYAYMMAMALYLGAEEVGTYGFEMATDTEYRYQKGSTEFWLGIAAGLGVTLHIPEKCKLLLGALYGWEVSRMINRQRLEFYRKRGVIQLSVFEDASKQITGRRKEVDGLAKGAKTKELKIAYQTRSSELLQEEIIAFGKARDSGGFVRAMDFLIDVCDNMALGKDPGDGYVGPKSDLDPAAEQAVQDAIEAEAKAEREIKVDV